MNRRLAIACTLLILMMLTIGLASASAASADGCRTTLRYRIVRHFHTYDKVRRHHRVLRIARTDRYAEVKGVPRYRVVKRTPRYLYLRTLSAAVSSSSTNTAIVRGAPASVGLPSSASSAQSWNSPAAANDGRSATHWTASSGSYPQWWMVDLGSVTTVSGVKTDWYRAAGRAYRYRVEASLDGITFATVADRSKNLKKGVTTDALDFSARYVRVQALGVSGGVGWASANEITVYTDATSPSDPEPLPTPTVTPAPTPTPPSGRVYCVSTSGNDNSAGTIVTPFRTLTRGVSVLAPGDILYVRGGTYVLTSALSISRSGTAAAPITVSAYPGETPIISGDVNGDGVCTLADTPGSKYSPLVGISGSHVTFSGFEVCYAGGRGVQASRSYDTVSNCRVHHIWNTGIYLTGSYGTVDSNTVYRCSEFNYRVGEAVGDWAAGICWGYSQSPTAPGMAPYATITGNTVYNNTGEGIIGMNTDYGLVQGNVCYDNWSVMGIYIDRCSYTTVERNLCYWTGDTLWSRFGGRGTSGILLSNESIGAGASYPIAHDNRVLNNIAVHCGPNIKFWTGSATGSALIDTLIAGNTCVEGVAAGILLEEGNSAVHEGTRIADNLVLQTGGSSGTVESAIGLTFDHNLWSKAPGSGCSGTGDIIGNPLLADPNHTVTAGGVSPVWYSLTAGSPAGGAGVAVSSVAADFFGGLLNDPPDIGALQYKP